MSRYHRWRQGGGVYFFTLVSFARRPILMDPAAREALRAAFRQTIAERNFEVDAVVLLPDHLHCIWRFEHADDDYSTCWRLIKSRFTQAMVQAGREGPPPNPSRQKRSEQAFWQRRFWEHCVRNDQDLKRHVDYIHYNPVKHGLARCAAEWPWSTFRRYIRLGEYDPTWGQAEPETIVGWNGAAE